MPSWPTSILVPASATNHLVTKVFSSACVCSHCIVTTSIVVMVAKHTEIAGRIAFA